MNSSATDRSFGTQIISTKTSWGSLDDCRVRHEAEQKFADLKHFAESSYTRSVTKITQRLEALLKVVVTPQVRSL
jgi:hypothetical protein